MKKASLVVVLTFVMLWTTVSAQQKYALVIGNSAYNSNIGRLSNPVNDANDMATALTRLGFQVDKVLNGSLDQMESAVIQLKNRLSTNPNAYGFFFYAGHGVQSGGDNYLIPVDANIQSESLLKQRAMSLQQFVLVELQESKNALNMIVLDACRNNGFSWTRGTSRGLFPMTVQPTGTIIAYGAGAGETADDGTGRNGLYTSQLLKNLATPNLSVRDIFDITIEDVQRLSDNKQNPVLYSNASGARNIRLLEPQVPRNVRAGTPGIDSVTLNWDSAGAGISYKVYYSTQNDASRATALGSSTTGTSFNVTEITSDSIYYFWVASIQNGQESAKSPVLSVRTAPVDATVYYNRGMEYYNKDDYDRAIAEFTEAIRINPQYANAYNWRGWAYYDKGEYDRAIADYTQAIRIDPQDANAYNWRGWVYDDKGEYDRAIADYTQAIRIDPQDTSAYYNRGLAYYNKGDYDRAIAEFTEAIRINPQYAYAYNHRGNAYDDKGEYNRAIADYTQALRIDPNYTTAKNNLEYARNRLAASQSTTKPVVTIVNNTGYTFYYLYGSKSTDAWYKEWGDDVLGTSILSSGSSLRVILPSTGTWDFLAEDSDGDAYSKYNITINGSTTVTFTMSDIER
ncbi:hypothetical protein FACS1894172_08980 [Spirochaetia bacterium]|nr:hypothetical protein FACS1894164_01070 [Spirochaetia bacterium]GHU32410.1 hypothetical protein FACS1894172_08980 [Spirochaetia bacterium]